MGQMESPSSWKVVKLVFLKKPDAAPTKGIRSYQAIALTSVMSTWYASCVLLRQEKDKRAWKVEELAHGWCERDKMPKPKGIDDEFIAKTLGVARRGEPRDEKHGTLVRPTMYLASMDTRTAFDEAKPKHVAWILDGHNTHGWLIAALLREILWLSGTASFESVETRFNFNRCLRQGSVGAPCRGRMDDEKVRRSLGCR